MSDLSTNALPGTSIRHAQWPGVFGSEQALPPLAEHAPAGPIRIAVVGNHLPRQCGIATFTTDLCDAIAVEYGSTGLQVAAVNDPRSTYLYPARVRSQIDEGDLASYRATAHSLNARNVDVVCLQHEYGIYGGKAGSHVLELLHHLAMPVITTLHTVLRQPDPDQHRVMLEIAERSDRLIVMSEYSSHILQEVFGVSAAKIDLIPHGIPDLPFADPAIYKDALALADKLVLLTFGLLSPNKGFESAIHALPRILARHSNAVYVIAGATHPQIRAREGDRYRDQLQDMARKLGVERQVIFHNHFVSPLEMASLIGSADIYITPYCQVAQAVSGTLAYAMGAGKAIISTPYWYAAELLNDGRGVLVPFENSAAIAAEAIELLDDDAKRFAMRRRAYLYARKMVWNQAAKSYMRAFSQVLLQHTQPALLGFPAQAAGKLVKNLLMTA